MCGGWCKKLKNKIQAYVLYGLSQFFGSGLTSGDNMLAISWNSPFDRSSLVLRTLHPALDTILRICVYNDSTHDNALKQNYWQTNLPLLLFVVKVRIAVLFSPSYYIRSVELFSLSVGQSTKRVNSMGLQENIPFPLDRCFQLRRRFWWYSRH